MTTPRVARLANGLTTVVLPVPASHQLLISLMVRVGSRFEPPGRAGISHFVEHLLFRGNSTYLNSAALFRAFEENGEILNGETGVEVTEYFQVVHPDRLAESLGCLAEFIRAPRFAELEKERRIILDEMLYDYNEQGQMIRLDTLAAEVLWSGTPLAHSVAGTRETVSAFTLEGAREHYRRSYFPANMVLALAGRLDAEEALAMVRSHFGDWSHPLATREPLPPPLSPWPFHGPLVRTVPDVDNQIRLQMSFPTTGYRAPDEIPLSLLTGILDDGPTTRLQQIIREERALVYHIGAAYTTYHDVGQFDISTAVAPERLIPLMDTLLAILADVRGEGVGSDELEAARRRYRYALEFSRDSLDSHIERFGWPTLFDAVRTEEEEREIMEGVPIERINRLAASLFGPERLHLVLVGPLDAELERSVRERVAAYR